MENKTIMLLQKIMDSVNNELNALYGSNAPQIGFLNADMVYKDMVGVVDTNTGKKKTIKSIANDIGKSGKTVQRIIKIDKCIIKELKDKIKSQISKSALLNFIELNVEQQKMIAAVLDQSFKFYISLKCSKIIKDLAISNKLTEDVLIYLLERNR